MKNRIIWITGNLEQKQLWLIKSCRTAEKIPLKIDTDEFRKLFNNFGIHS